MNPLNFRGLLAATVTPMNDRGDINLEPIPRVLDYLERTGIVGIYILGSTSNYAAPIYHRVREAFEAGP